MRLDFAVAACRSGLGSTLPPARGHGLQGPTWFTGLPSCHLSRLHKDTSNPGLWAGTRPEAQCGPNWKCPTAPAPCASLEAFHLWERQEKGKAGFWSHRRWQLSTRLPLEQCPQTQRGSHSLASQPQSLGQRARRSGTWLRAAGARGCGGTAWTPQKSVSSHELEISPQV